MYNKKTELYFLLIVLTGIFILTFFIFRPFIFALILATVFATVLEPIHRKSLSVTKGRNGLAALLSTFVVLILIITPLVFLGIQIFHESTALYASLLQGGDSTGLSGVLRNTIENILGGLPVNAESVDVDQYLKLGLGWVIQHIGLIFANIAKILLGLFIFLIALYYVFKDGKKLRKIIIKMSPLEDVHDEVIFGKLGTAVNSIVRGNLLVSLIQGTLIAIGFTIFGVPNAVLWGTVGIIAAMIPGIGTALVILPAVIYLYFNGAILPMTGLLIWGVVAVGLVDNFLGPKFVEQGLKVHSFIILLSILGGLSLFGPLGFILGPLVLCLLFAFLEIYMEINKGEEIHKV